MKRFKISLYIILVSVAVSCSKPGYKNSTVTEMWLNRCDIIIGSLGYYYAVNHSYPESLSELVPYYVSEFPVPVIDSDMLKYRKVGSSFEISFEHRQPDYKECRYSPALGWRCFGYE